MAAEPMSLKRQEQRSDGAINKKGDSTDAEETMGVVNEQEDRRSSKRKRRAVSRLEDGAWGDDAAAAIAKHRATRNQKTGQRKAPTSIATQPPNKRMTCSDSKLVAGTSKSSSRHSDVKSASDIINNKQRSKSAPSRPSSAKLSSAKKPTHASAKKPCSLAETAIGFVRMVSAWW